MNQTVLFSLDQRFANGVQAAGDLAGVRRACEAIRPLQKRFVVCAGVSPLGISPRHWSQLLAVLDTLAGAGVGFVVDVYSSDALAILGDWTSAWDVSHGIPVPVQKLYELSARYGGGLAGLRFHELSSTSVTIQGGRAGWLKWWDGFSSRVPVGEFYRQELAEPFVAFAHNLSIPLYWSDPYWLGNHPADAGQAVRERSLRDLTAAYPGTVIPMYANNLDGQGLKNSYWRLLEPNLLPQTRGWGLSDQQWIYPGATPEALTEWGVAALKSGCVCLQTEPAWFWLKFPVGDMHDASSAGYVSGPYWQDSGSALPSLGVLMKALLAL